MAVRIAKANVHSISDNQACQKGVRTIMQGRKGPPILPGKWDVTGRLTRNMDHRATWVPSHGKSADWLPPEGSADTTRLRKELNNAADEAASAALKEAMDANKKIAQERCLAANWSDRALSVQQEASEKLLKKRELAYMLDVKHQRPVNIKRWIATDREPPIGNRIVAHETS